MMVYAVLCSTDEKLESKPMYPAFSPRFATPSVCYIGTRLLRPRQHEKKKKKKEKKNK
jgi:hypothetical protein